MHEYDLCTLLGRVAQGEVVIMRGQKGLTEESLNKIKEAKPSITINTLTEEERKPFKETAADVEAQFLEIGGSQALAILEDRMVGTWEVVFRMEVEGGSPSEPPGWEHDELRLIKAEALPAPASDAAIALQPLAREVLASRLR